MFAIRKNLKSHPKKYDYDKRIMDQPAGNRY